MSEMKAIILDIDGTLTNSRKEITPRTKEALVRAQERGVKIILASGRPTAGLMKFAKELGATKNGGLLVSFNGSKVVSAQTGEVYFNQPMSVEDGRAVLKHIEKFDRIRPMIDRGDYMYVKDVYDCWITLNGEPFNVMRYESRGNSYKLCEKADLAEFADEPLNKILTFADPVYLEEHYEELMEPFKDRLSCMFTSPFYFEFTAQGIDKAKALDSVLPGMGILRENIIAFGDAQNDRTMLEYAGVGIAMGNAVDSLKEIADEVTLSNEEDGIAAALEKYFS